MSPPCCPLSPGSKAGVAWGKGARSTQTCSTPCVPHTTAAFAWERSVK